MTLTQSDKWLRQAGVIDGWEVTTTDTAIFFRSHFRNGSMTPLKSLIKSERFYYRRENVVFAMYMAY
jgi:hypothetical protein